jgi:hypothetical protein
LLLTGNSRARRLAVASNNVNLSDAAADPLETKGTPRMQAGKTEILPLTVYQVEFGGGYQAPERRYFRAEHQCDAAMRLAHAILELDRGPESCAHASLERLPDQFYPEGVTLVSWTKTSDERPTHIGFNSVEEILKRFA